MDNFNSVMNLSYAESQLGKVNNTIIICYEIIWYYPRKINNDNFPRKY